jgi:hypothetical protein
MLNSVQNLSTCSRCHHEPANPPHGCHLLSNAFSSLVDESCTRVQSVDKTCPDQANVGAALEVQKVIVFIHDIVGNQDKLVLGILCSQGVSAQTKKAQSSGEPVVESRRCSTHDTETMPVLWC